MESGVLFIAYFFVSLLECNRVEKRTKVHKLDPPGTLIQTTYLLPMVWLEPFVI